MEDFEGLINKECQRKQQAMNYLNDTDYQRLREADGGEPMSDEVKTKRATAREVVNECELNISRLQAQWDEAIRLMEEDMHPSDEDFNVE